MDMQEYVRQRVDDQIRWYSGKSTSNKRWYTVLQTIEIILAALIPFLVGYTKTTNWAAIITGSFGVVITVIESVSKLNKFHENWIYYRTTSELLKHQKQLYLSHSSPYNETVDTVDNIFVKNIEQIISSENGQWKTINTRERQGPRE